MIHTETTYNPLRSDDEHLQTLQRVIARVQAATLPKVVIFDLDSTIFDNRPRQVQIFREFGVLKGIDALYHINDHHFTDWNLEKPMLKAGMQAEAVKNIAQEFKHFWKNRFFTSPYCLYDVAFPKAADFIVKLYQMQTTIVYLTGRHEGMREGTLESLKRFGFPAPEMLRTHLEMKPQENMFDDDFKRIAHQKVRGYGEVVAAFDNEPAHANQLKNSFPDADVVWIDSDRSTQEFKLHEKLLKAYGYQGF